MGGNVSGVTVVLMNSKFSIPLPWLLPRAEPDPTLQLVRREGREHPDQPQPLDTNVFFDPTGSTDAIGAYIQI